ncbi:MAG: hypothetical protein WC371_00085 [Parachlamydiales bacterium]|jgi:O-antigen/teichoic acid export membrane protein
MSSVIHGIGSGISTGFEAAKAFSIAAASKIASLAKVFFGAASALVSAHPIAVSLTVGGLVLGSVVLYVFKTKHKQAALTLPVGTPAVTK